MYKTPTIACRTNDSNRPHLISVIYATAAGMATKITSIVYISAKFSLTLLNILFEATTRFLMSLFSSFDSDFNVVYPIPTNNCREAGVSVYHRTL